ncbi:MAG TPA: hypothetical protein VF331_18940 [Polyangiales bacterium]
MDAPPLDVSPVASFLLALAERRQSGGVTVGDRRLRLQAGEVCDMAAAPGDPDFPEFLIASGRVAQERLNAARAQHGSTELSGDDWVTRGLLTQNEWKNLRRALWLDRFVRALRLAAERGDPPPTLEPERTSDAGGGNVPLLRFTLDALTRLAVDGDATAVGVRLNHRLQWVDGPLTEEAKRWAALGETSDRPVVSAILARFPACAPQLAALLRTGLLRLQAPGTPGARAPSRTGTLPPPAPRLSVVPESPPAPLTLQTHRPPLLPRAPRVRLDPGADGIPIESIPQVDLGGAQTTPVPLHDPLRELELRIAALEARQAPGPERARAFVELSRLWHSRIGSLEEAARALREAASADPSDPQVLQDAALHCSYLGQTELAIAYARGAIAASAISVERAAAYRLLADIHRACDDIDGCVEALSEAAAEDPSRPEAHELLSHLLSERDNLPVAVAHARLAALGWVEHDKPRAAVLYGLAYAWNPADALLADEYAALQVELGYTEAAIAVLAETARNLEQPELRKRVRLGAAQRAEAAGRKDLSAELLTELFDDEPSFDLIYAPLDEDLGQTGQQADELAMLETIATSCPHDQAPVWLARAGEIALGLPGERTTALALLARALNANPTLARPMELLLRAGGTRPEIQELASGDEARIAQLQAQLREPLDEADELAVHAQLGALYARRPDPRAVATAALRALTIDPKHATSLSRLWRAAAALRDPALTREALALRARAKEGGRQQARALVALARHLENLGDFDAAVASADAALASDATAADAAIVLLRHAHRMEPSRAVARLTHARTLLGELPALLSAIAEAARAAADHDTQLSVLHAWCERLPYFPEARLSALDFHLTQSDPAPILAEAEALLRDAGGPLIVSRAKEAVSRLHELSAHADAARLAQRVMDELGRADAQYADEAVELARAADDPALLATALERAASTVDGAARLSRLLLLAEHHAQRGDRVGQLRALLRALAVDATCMQALEGLATLFAQSGDENRLLTVLSLSLQAQTDPAQRRQRLLDLASAAAHVGNDLPRALAYLKTLMLESAEDREGLLTSLGALFALGEPRWAIEQARVLARELPDEAGGSVYLWTARKAEVDLQDPALALELASEGARQFPAVGELLLMVERLTLPTADRTAALAVYDALIAAAIGPHGQRALHYRAGRWLERSGVPDEALAHYAQAFSLAKGAGVAFKAIERVARETGRLGPLVDAQEALAVTLRDQEAQFAMLCEAARTALHELDDPARGFALLMKADELARVGELDEQLVDAATRLGSRDAGARERALTELATTWEQRAEKAWDAEAKTQLLLHTARMHLLQRNDPAGAIRALSSALTPAVAESLPVELRAATLTTMAEALLAAGREHEAATALQSALEAVPEHPEALAVRSRLKGRPSAAKPLEPSAPAVAKPNPPPSAAEPPAPGPAASPATSTASRIAIEPTEIRDEKPANLGVVSTRVRRSEPPLRMLPSAPEAAATAPELQVRQAPDAGDPRALEDLLSVVGADPQRQAEAHSLLGQLVRADPSRTESLRQLHAGAVAQGALAEAAVTAEILALFDPSIAATQHAPFHAGLFREGELSELVEAGARGPAVRRLLALLWENARALPRFRRTLDSYDVSPRQRVSPNTDGPVAMAYARAARLLAQTDTPLYLKPKASPALTVVPTHPPAVIARADLSELPALTYRVAQCLVWAQADNALLCVLPEQEGRDLIAALLGAFGPAGSVEKLDRAGKELASALWHTVPMRTQAQMRELIAAHWIELDYDALRHRAGLSAHRAGLFVLANATQALEALTALEPSLRGVEIHSETGFQEACALSEAFSETIRSALSEPYLSLVAQVI